MTTKLFIYQVLPRLFGNTKNVNKENGTLEENGVGKFSAFSSKAISEIKKMGFTHIWLTGILEHASKTDYSSYGIRKDNPEVIKGNAGSPYAIRDYYDVSPDLADTVENRIEEFEALVERIHKAGLKVIIDFVPNHVARQYHSDAKPRRVEDFGAKDNTNEAFNPDNNFYYIPEQSLELQFPLEDGVEHYSEFPAKATGNDKFDNKPGIYDWYETVKLNYGVDYLDCKKKYFTPIPDTWYKMLDILLYWSAKGVDGFRCDMAEMVPVEFWNWVIARVHSKYKSTLFIAEVYNPEEYGNYTFTGKFDYLYDKVGLYDTLRDVTCGNKSAAEITYCWQRLYDLQPRMLNFLENHDEQRIASDFFAGDPAKAIPAMIISATMNVNPVMIYAGQELGEKGMDKEGFSGRDGRTSIFDYWSVETLRNWYNEGNFGNTLLTEEQISLRQFYIKLIHIAKEESAISQGKFFDLMYVNYDKPDFDCTKQYAFLRAYGNELILVAVNFSHEEKDIHISIPAEAFEYLEIDSLEIKSCKELLSGKLKSVKDGLLDSYTTKLSGFSGKIFKFSVN